MKERIGHIIAILVLALTVLAAFGYALGYFDLTFIRR